MIYTYNHMEEFDGVVFPDFRQYSGNLIVYGAGINGALCTFALEEMDIDFLCFCDSDPAKQGQRYLGYPVLSPEECHIKFPGAAILFDVYNLAMDLENLTSLGYHTILFPAPLFLGMDCEKAAKYITERLERSENGYSLREQIDAPQVFEWIDEYMIRGVRYATGKRTVPHAINLDITDCCTLRCKNCLAFKAYFKQPRHMDWFKLNQVLDKLIEMKWFRRFHILGGEPLLYPHLSELIKKLSDVQEVEHINIITNGTILPSQSTLDTLKNPKVMIRISYYGDLSAKYQDLEKLCHDNGVNVRVHAQRWVNIGRPLEVVSNEKDTQNRFDLCCQNRGAFFYILHGKATRCPFAANTYALGLFEAADSDFVDLTSNVSSNMLFSKLNDLYWGKSPLTACQYCNGWLSYSTQSVPVAEQCRGGEFPSFPQYE